MPHPLLSPSWRTPPRCSCGSCPYCQAFRKATKLWKVALLVCAGCVLLPWPTLLTSSALATWSGASQEEGFIVAVATIISLWVVVPTMYLLAVILTIRALLYDMRNGHLRLSHLLLFVLGSAVGGANLLIFQ